MRERQIRAFDILERDLGSAMKSAPQPLRSSAITLTDVPPLHFASMCGAVNSKCTTGMPERGRARRRRIGRIHQVPRAALVRTPGASCVSETESGGEDQREN